jgi:cytochrome c biogenesis protein CcmG/thiol:disulfide interchange protein DsbE
MYLSSKSKLLTIFLLVFFLFNFGCQKEVGADTVAPDFSLSDLSGNMASLEQHRGSVVLLDFWATWCPPCRMSIPEIVKLQKKFGEKGLVIFGISMDDPQMVTDEQLRVFKERVGINYSVLRVNRQVLRDYFGDKQISIPTMFVIDRDGKIRDKLVGFRPGALEKSVSEIL